MTLLNWSALGRTKIDEEPTSDESTRNASADHEASTDHFRTLGLDESATWDQVTEAHARLVSDLTPGPGASHRNVSLAEELLREVNQAFHSLRIQSVA